MAWFFLILAGFFEAGFTTALRYVEGFTRIPPTIIFILCGGMSLYLLQKSSEDIPVGTAYAVWTGVGAGITVVVGMVAYNEPITILRVVFLTQLVLAIVGLNLISAK